MSLVRAGERCSVLGPALYGAEQHSPPISSQLSLLRAAAIHQAAVSVRCEIARALMSSLRFAFVSFFYG